MYAKEIVSKKKSTKGKAAKGMKKGGKKKKMSITQSFIKLIQTRSI